MSVDDAFNFKKINETVSIAGLLSEEQLGQLGSEGYEVVINLLPHDSEYAIKNEVSIVQGQGIEYEYIPVDFSCPLANDYKEFADKLTAYSTKKIMAHCAANYRVSAFYSIYAFDYHGWSKSEVYDFIATIWDIREHPVWEEFVSNRVGANND